MNHKFNFSFFGHVFFFFFFQLPSNDDFSPNIALFALTFLPHMPRGIIFHMRKKNLYFAVVLHLYVDVSLVDRPRLAGGITIICGRYFRSSSLVYVVFGIFVMYDVVFGYW